MYLIPILLLSVLLFYVTIEKNMKGLLYFMKRYDFTITSDRGLHAQPVAALASIACKVLLVLHSNMMEEKSMYPMRSV